MDIKNNSSLLKMCRSCLKSIGTISLFKKEENLFISQILLLCTSVKVSKEDLGPLQLCSVCMHRLKDAFMLRNQCQESEARLKELYIIQPEIKMEAFENSVDDHEEKSSDCELPHADYLSAHSGDEDDKSLLDIKHNHDGIFYKTSTRKSRSYEVFLNDHKHRKNRRSMRDRVAGHSDTESKLEIKICEKNIKALHKNDTSKKVKKKNRILAKQLKYFCDVCPYAAPESYLLNRHMRIHTGEKPYKCDLCDARFTTTQARRFHQQSHNKIVCDVCGKLFKNTQTLHNHKNVHVDTKSFQCHLCLALYSTNMQLNVHVKRSHNLNKRYKKLPCQICNRIFDSKFLKLHMQSHSDDPAENTCTICHTVLKGGKYSLKAHMLRHTEGRKYICDCCSKSFNEKTNLRVHMLKHFGVKKFKCEECSKCFVYKSALVSHKVTHLKTKDHVCDVCNQKFARLNSLSEHRKKKHNILSQRRVASRSTAPLMMEHKTFTEATIQQNQPVIQSTAELLET